MAQNGVRMMWYCQLVCRRYFIALQLFISQSIRLKITFIYQHEFFIAHLKS